MVELELRVLPGSENVPCFSLSVALSKREVCGRTCRH